MRIVLKGNDLIDQHSKVGKEHILGTSSSQVSFLFECEFYNGTQKWQIQCLLFNVIQTQSIDTQFWYLLRIMSRKRYFNV